MGTHTIWLRCVVEADSPVAAGVKLLGACEDVPATIFLEADPAVLREAAQAVVDAIRTNQPALERNYLYAGPLYTLRAVLASADSEEER